MRRNSIIPLLLALLMVCQSLAGQNLAVQKEKRRRLEKDIALLQKQLSSTSSRSDQAISSLSLISAQKKSQQKLMNESDLAIKSYDGQIAIVKKDINKQKAALDTLQAHFSRLLMGAYKNRDVKIWYMYILSSENVSQAFRRFGYFKDLSSQIQVQAAEIKKVQENLNEKRIELQDLRSKEKKVREQRASEYEKLKATEAEQSKLVNKLKKDKAAYKASLAAKQKEMRQLDTQIAKMLAAASGKDGSKKKPIDYTLATAFEMNFGKLPWPVDGPVTDHFGPYKNLELKLSLFNNGISIACAEGTPVKAVFDGVVSSVMLMPGYGQCALVQHGNYYTTYCKIKNVRVRQGEKIKTGQTIAEVSTIMGKTQLYFLVWKKQYLDPEEWLRPR